MSTDEFAKIAPSAKIGKNVKIGPFVVIGENTVIGNDCVLEPFSLILANSILGNANHIHPHVVIGGEPQSKFYEKSDKQKVVIGDNNLIREGTTIHKSTNEREPTEIGSDNMIMTNVHIGHDCKIGNGNVLASLTSLGGHVVMGNHIVTGAAVLVHQFCRIGSRCMIGGGTSVRKDILPFSMAAQDGKALHYGLNKIGLERGGFSPEKIKQIGKAFKALKNNEKIFSDELFEDQDLLYLSNWLKEKSDRGITAFTKPKKIR